MNQKEALKHLNVMMFALQRFRSIVSEAHTDKDAEFLERYYPWGFGDKCPLEALQKVIDRGSVTANEFYNFMTIVDKIMPELQVIALIEQGHDFPKPDIGWFLEIGFDVRN